MAANISIIYWVNKYFCTFTVYFQLPKTPTNPSKMEQCNCRPFFTATCKPIFAYKISISLWTRVNIRVAKNKLQMVGLKHLEI